MPAATGVVAVVVTRDRPQLLRRCLAAIARQSVPVDRTIVVDDAGSAVLDAALDDALDPLLIRLAANRGPAASFGIGIGEALGAGARHVWLMDDDGAPEDDRCLESLLVTASREGAGITCPLVRDIADPRLLAFPIRQTGRTRFSSGDLAPARLIEGFAHLFNGALITSAVFDRIGLPNPALFIRGDEVEFLLRARRAGVKIVTDASVGFLHPSSAREIHPILGGRFHATEPLERRKQHCQFRNRGWIFSRYGMWSWLAADHARYAFFYLGEKRDPAAYVRWLRSTWSGVAGRIGPPEACRNDAA